MVFDISDNETRSNINNLFSIIIIIIIKYLQLCCLKMSDCHLVITCVLAPLGAGWHKKTDRHLYFF